MGFQGKVKVSMSLPLWGDHQFSPQTFVAIDAVYQKTTEHLALKMSAEKCSRGIVIISTKSCSRVQELHTSWSRFPGYAVILLCHLAIKYLLDIAWHLSPSNSISLHATNDAYQLLFCLSRETETVTVERYYTSIGTSGKNSAKFMPFALRNPARTPRVL